MRLDVFLCVVQGLHCRSRAFSSCGERGQCFAAVRGRLQAVTSLVVERKHLSTLCVPVSISRPQNLPREPHATGDLKGRTGNTQRGGVGKPRAPSCLGASPRLGVWPARTRVSAVGAAVRTQHLLTLVDTGAGRESLCVAPRPGARHRQLRSPHRGCGPRPRGLLVPLHAASAPLPTLPHQGRPPSSYTCQTPPETRPDRSSPRDPRSSRSPVSVFQGLQLHGATPPPPTWAPLRTGDAGSRPRETPVARRTAHSGAERL